MKNFNISKAITVLTASFIYLFFFCSISALQAQTTTDHVYKYARKIIDTLASASTHGRGYVNDGDKIAANYIRTEFQKNGLQSFTDNYFQPFSLSINTFPGKISVKTDGIELTPGKDFIVSSRSPSYHGKHAVVMADEKLVSRRSRR